MLRKIAALVGLLLAGPLAAQAPVPGAKELFYDPVNATATRVSAGSEPAKSAGTGSKLAAPARLDKRGRRQVSLPSDSQAGQARTALGVSYWIELQGPQGSTGIQVTDHRVFRSGERIRLHFRTNTDGDIALVQLGSSGTGQMLFPDPGKGLADSRLKADEDKILPNDESWFRFDDHPGTERLIVLFARNRADLQRFPVKASMDARETGTLVQDVRRVQGSKDLFVETETRNAAEVGTYGVSVSGQPVVLEIALEHK